MLSRVLDLRQDVRPVLRRNPHGCRRPPRRIQAVPTASAAPRSGPGDVDPVAREIGADEVGAEGAGRVHRGARALQTITTVGYGDVVPTAVVGRFIGGVEMVLGISFIAFLTAGVTSVVIQRGQAGAAEDERRRAEHDLRTIVDALSELRTAIGDLDRRLDKIE
jgi:hypothetical protein